MPEKSRHIFVIVTLRLASVALVASRTSASRLRVLKWQ
jgi:hypothetical protein